jgi:hypothetical protein
MSTNNNNNNTNTTNNNSSGSGSLILPSTGRKTGCVNYRNKVLIDIVDEIKPHGAEQWKKVGLDYQTATGELVRRDDHDLKKHFVQLCNGFKKPTGKPGAANDQVPSSNALTLTLTLTLPNNNPNMIRFSNAKRFGGQY